MYELIEVSLADLTRHYKYHLEDAYRVKFTLKGFVYPWIVNSHCWKPGEKVLDVGAGYSPLPIYIQETFGCEVWAADDYGLKSNEPFWTRGSSPQEHAEKHPEVKFVPERLGNPDISSLPANYFDVIYSASALEHVPYENTQQVWRHMDHLLKRGGEMLHAVDVPFPSNAGWKKVLAALGFDFFYDFLPQGFKLKHYLATPNNYARLVLKELGVNLNLRKDLSVINMVLNPDILTESYQFGLNRILKDKQTNYRYQRVGTLLLKIKKLQ